jgi:choline dehydrogenase-like flavoprotein
VGRAGWVVRMLIHSPELSHLAALDCMCVVIGGGPLGLSMGLHLANRGTRVLLLESGGPDRAGAAQDLAADDLLTPDTHYDPKITVARRLGGTSNLWGGRCVPYDAIDFEARPWLGLDAWPITKIDLDPWLGPACAALGAGAPVFDAAMPGAAPRSDAFGVTTLERWSNQPRTQILHGERLREAPNLIVATGVTVTGFDHAPDGQVTALHLWIDSPGEPERGTLPVRQVILAAGGNASTRLLLNAQDRHPALFGGPDGLLGRFYMGHVNGQIADIVFENDALHALMNFHVDAHGSYVRRRFAPSPALQRELELANVVFWPVVPEISQPEHLSGPLSAVFLALTLPGIGHRLIAEAIRIKQVGLPPYRRLLHLSNVLRDLPATVGFVPWLLWNRFGGARHRLPGFFLTNPGRHYGLEFHSEHLPCADSRMTLSDRRDRTGLRHLKIDFRFSNRDVDSVLRAHDAIEAWLMAEGYGRLVYRVPEGSRAEGVLAEAKHGNHQQGTIRLGSTSANGVVDPFGTCFDVPNLHVVSTAILPTSSHANPTLTALQIGLRLADRLYPAL